MVSQNTRYKVRLDLLCRIKTFLYTMNTRFIAIVAVAIMFASLCDGRRGRLDTCAPCKEMLRSLVEDTRLYLCSFGQCMDNRHGMLTNISNEYNNRHSNAHITFQGVYQNVTVFALQLEAIRKYGRDDVVYDCLNHNLQENLMKILCLLNPTQLERGLSQNDCTKRLPRTFRRLNRSAKIDHVMHFIQNLYTQMGDFIRVLL